jgi:hypothetical protein
MSSAGAGAVATPLAEGPRGRAGRWPPSAAHQRCGPTAPDAPPARRAGRRTRATGGGAGRAVGEPRRSARRPGRVGGRARRGAWWARPPGASLGAQWEARRGARGGDARRGRATGRGTPVGARRGCGSRGRVRRGSAGSASAAGVAAPPAESPIRCRDRIRGFRRRVRARGEGEPALRLVGARARRLRALRTSRRLIRQRGAAGPSTTARTMSTATTTMTITGSASPVSLSRRTPGMRCGVSSWERRRWLITMVMPSPHRHAVQRVRDLHRRLLVGR